MSKVAFIFPGQGSQKVGMGRQAAEQVAEAREVFERADAALKLPLSRLCFEGPEDELRLTENTQPALLTVSVALFRAFGETPDVVAGHSLGEYSAHVAAQSLDFEDALRLVRMRGRFMQEAVPVGQGAMAAILKLERTQVERLCSEAQGVVEAVNFNAPGQIVIAGEASAVSDACNRVKKEGGRAIALPVSAPFHSSLMRPAEERLRPYLSDTVFSDPSFPVVVNVDAKAVTKASDSRTALERQVSRAVRWEESVHEMVNMGVSLFVEIGAGNVLSGLIRRIDGSVQGVSVQSPDDFDQARAAVNGIRAS